MNRRTFITGCGSVALSSGLSAANTNRMRIGQIGTTGAHASGKMMAMRGLKELWDVAGIVEPEAHLLQSPVTTRAWQGLRVLTEEELLGMPDVKAVAVETRIGDATQTALRVLRAGKHVHLEKPGGFSHADYKAMRLEAERRNLIVQMGYMLRYNPAFELLYRAAREKWLGDITEIDVFIGKLGDPQTRNFIHQLPGGGMFELGCHVIDTVITLLGVPKSVTAFSTPSKDDGAKDNQMAVFEYPRATAVVRCNFADPFGDHRRRISVTGTEGTLEIIPMESRNVTLSLDRDRGSYRKGTQKFQFGQPGGRYDGEFIDLYRVLRGEKRFMWDAAHDIAVHEAVLRSSGVWEGDGR
jgi:predicted dehydrogenase